MATWKGCIYPIEIYFKELVQTTMGATKSKMPMASKLEIQTVADVVALSLKCVG